MVRGIYTAASGMLVQQANTDVTSNNLANVDTVGFHQQSAHIRSFPEELLYREHNSQRTPIGRLGTGAIVDGSNTSFQQGRIEHTNNSLDIAIVGHGFIVLDSHEGSRYTRDGRFVLNQTGWLVNQDGYRVRGENGPIFVGEGKVDITSEGDIYVDDQFRDRLLVVEFPDRSGLVRQGASSYTATPEAGQPFRYNALIEQGALQMSNVNLIKEMVGLIEVHRSYEANQKVVQAYDETLGKAVNEIAG